MIEPLETRRMFAASFTVDISQSTDTVAIELSSSSDTFNIKYHSGIISEALFSGASALVGVRHDGSLTESAAPSEWESIGDYLLSYDFTRQYFIGRVNNVAFFIPLGKDWLEMDVESEAPDETYHLIGRVSTTPRLRVEGRGGDDLISVDSNMKNIRAYVYGENGKDTIIGGVYIDSLFGGAGNDSIVTNARNRAYLEGNAGNDILMGGPARDTVQGDGGNDQLDGGDYRSGLATIHFKFKLSANTGSSNSTSTLTDLLYGDTGYDTAVNDSRDYRESIEYLVNPTS